MSSLTFNINKEVSERENVLIIDIETPTPSNLNAGSLKKLAESPAEKEAISFLIQEEKNYQKKLKGQPPNEAALSFNRIHIRYPFTLQALKYLAATGKLYFKNKAIVCDFYSQNEYYYCVEKDQEKIKVSARLKTSLQDFEITESDFVCGGPPHFVIKGISLKLIDSDISWGEIKKALQQELKPEDILEEPNNPKAPKIIYLGVSREKLESLQDPLPVLVLKDRSGAFADLWMNYERKDLISFHDPIKKSSFKRNTESEKDLEKDLLETDFIRKEVGTSHYYCPIDKVAKSLGFLLELGWQIKDFKDQYVVLFTGTQMTMQSLQQAILIKGKIKFGDYEVDLSSIEGTFNRKERFVQLNPGRVGLFSQPWEETSLAPLFEEGEVVSEGIRLHRSRIGILSDLWETQQEINVDEQLKELRERLASFKEITMAPPSIAFQGQLRPYQQEGVNWISFLYEYGFHGILADDMGLGKTVQVLAFLSQLKLTAPVLIIVPTSLIFNWRKEIQQFLPTWKIRIHQGPDRLKSFDEIEGQQIIITSYTIQVIKNHYTQTSQAVCQLNTSFRLSLTGTPLENNLNELWSHFRFLMPDLLGEQKDFESELLAASSDFRYLQRIKKKIRPFILRRKKEDVAKDLPEKIQQIVWIEMAPPQRQLYDEYVAGVRGHLLKKIELEGASKHRMEILEAILRLRQICCHPLLVSSGHPESGKLPSSKQEVLLQDLETLLQEGKKVLVYSQFTRMLKLMARELTSRQWKFVYLDGSTPDREKIVDQFQSDSTIPIFLISLKAGGIGLNLTRADYVLIYDPWWNEAAENQAIDRAHRIGRLDTVIAKRYVTLETIEEKMMTLKSHKRSLIGEVLEDDWNNLSVTPQDLEFLLS
jgi:SNF2 family DNA or RNA helicase